MKNLQRCGLLSSLTDTLHRSDRRHRSRYRRTISTTGAGEDAISHPRRWGTGRRPRRHMVGGVGRRRTRRRGGTRAGQRGVHRRIGRVGQRGVRRRIGRVGQRGVRRCIGMITIVGAMGEGGRQDAGTLITSIISRSTRGGRGEADGENEVAETVRFQISSFIGLLRPSHKQFEGRRFDKTFRVTFPDGGQAAGFGALTLKQLPCR